MNRLFATFDDSTENDLGELCRALLAQQKTDWNDLRKGYETLRNVRHRHVSLTGSAVRLQHNPGRARSTLAQVQPEKTRLRPCFLCPANLPEGQAAILYRNEFLVLANPMPVFDGHLTISGLSHRPQTIAGNLSVMLRLMSDLPSRWTVLYNGPRCGASAPDHFHLQAIPAGNLPIEEELRRPGCCVPLFDGERLTVSRAVGLAREALIFDGRSPVALAGAFETLLGALRKILAEADEPMISLAGSFTRGVYRLIVFPRRKHRPDAFFREDEGRLAVSPAAMEMAGVVVAPVESDFDRLDGSSIEAIFEEVSLPGEAVYEALRVLLENLASTKPCNSLHSW